MLLGAPGIASRNKKLRSGLLALLLGAISRYDRGTQPHLASGPPRKESKCQRRRGRTSVTRQSLGGKTYRKRSVFRPFVVFSFLFLFIFLELLLLYMLFLWS